MEDPMFGWLKNMVFNLKQLQGSIDCIESLTPFQRMDAIAAITGIIYEGLLGMDKNEITQKEIIQYLEGRKNDVIKNLKLTDERNVEFSMFWIPLNFFRALAIPDASDGKQALSKVLQLLIKGPESAAKSYVFEWCGLKV